ncbi:MAG: hypothetical protein KBD01_16415 [Acidobacteria bacterium]|nr:hypothetical protein [Acidobacteriota bacterium]
MFEKELAELERLDSHARGAVEARQRIHARIRDIALQDPRCLESVNSLDPHDATDAIRLADIYEALAPAAPTLESFFAAQLSRILASCRARPRSRPAFGVLIAFMFLESCAPDTLRRRLRALPVEGLRSDRASLRRACADLLGGHRLADDAPAREAVYRSLSDPDWRVRALAESSLEEEGLLPPDYRPSVLDRLRRRFLSWTDYV